MESRVAPDVSVTIRGPSTRTILGSPARNGALAYSPRPRFSSVRIAIPAEIDGPPAPLVDLTTILLDPAGTSDEDEEPGTSCTL
jgi:hypothetical protein